MFHFYETICVEHVLEMQMQQRHVRRLVQRNPNASESEARALVPEGRLARSSLIGQDICGDNALPEPEGSDESSDEDTVDADSTADAEGSTSDGKKKKNKKKYTSLQLLQIGVQDKTYLYLTVHIFRIVSPFFQGLLKDKRKEYDADKDKIRTKSPRGRMPWSVYKKIILDRLQKGHGWHFLCQLVNMFRHNGEQRRSWLLRVETGREWSTKFDTRHKAVRSNLCGTGWC